MSEVGGKQHPVRLGLVGLGWGERVAAAMERLREVELTVCHARTAAMREDFALRYGCRVAATWPELLADPTLDGVILMTPNSTHGALAIEAMRAGKHVLVTKPMATTLADAAAMVRVASETGRVLCVGHQSRRHPAQRALHRLVASGALGVPQRIEGNTSSPTGLAREDGAWRDQAAECPGGPLMQLGIHYIDNFQHLLGSITTVTGRMTPARNVNGGVEATATLFRFDSDVTGYLGSSYVAPKTRWTVVTGDEARAVADTDGSLRIQRIDGGDMREIMPAVVDPKAVLADMLAAEVEEFGACIRAGAYPEVSPSRAARNLAVVLATIEADRDGGWVDVDALLRPWPELS